MSTADRETFYYILRAYICDGRAEVETDTADTIEQVRAIVRFYYEGDLDGLINDLLTRTLRVFEGREVGLCSADFKGKG